MGVCEHRGTGRQRQLLPWPPLEYPSGKPPPSLFSVRKRKPASTALGLRLAVGLRRAHGEKGRYFCCIRSRISLLRFLRKKRKSANAACRLRLAVGLGLGVGDHNLVTLRLLHIAGFPLQHVQRRSIAVLIGDARMKRLFGNSNAKGGKGTNLREDLTTAGSSQEGHSEQEEQHRDRFAANHWCSRCEGHCFLLEIGRKTADKAVRGMPV